MTRFVELEECEGFIKDLFRNVQNSLNEEQVKCFADLGTEEARYKFVSQIKCVKDFEVTRTPSIKDLKLALDFKQKGNKAFEAKNWIAAVENYNKSLLILPNENGEFSYTKYSYKIQTMIFDINLEN